MLNHRYILTCLSFLIATIMVGQAAKIQAGKPFQRVVKNAVGDQYTVVDGILLNDQQALLYVEEGTEPKVVRLDAQLHPTDELTLKNVAHDGQVWNGVAPLIVDGTLHCLLVSAGKKTTDYAIGQVGTRGTPALSGLRKVASSDIPFTNEAANALPHRPQPNSILFSKGLAYAHQERLVAALDGQHFLLNYYTHNGKGAKRFWYAYLDKNLNELWSGTATLPYDDTKSRIHQISLANDGTIHLMAYVFQCASDEQMGDKMCHELHLTTLTGNGKDVKDVLIDKDFVSTARLCERDSGKVSMAMRYGALTGQPGWVLTFNPLDPKLKSTPLVDQRVASIRKTKLMAYGSIEPGAKKTTVSRTAKVPNEVVDLLPAWDGGLVLVETFLEIALQVPLGDAIAMRRLAGDVRTSYVAANDSIQWQHIAERAFMTTAGGAYEGVEIRLSDQGLTLLYDHTPKGLEAILLSGSVSPDSGDEKTKSKKEKLSAPVESGVMKSLTLDPRGNVVRQGTVLLNDDGLLPCPMKALSGPSGNVYLVKRSDRNTTYDFSLIDVTKVAP
jgi:hypothetical protein